MCSNDISLCSVMKKIVFFFFVIDYICGFGNGMKEVFFFFLFSEKQKNYFEKIMGENK